jgi:hypothetical protein
LFLQTRGDLYKVCPRGKEVTDEGESRSDPAAWSSVWISTKELVGVSPSVVEEITKALFSRLIIRTFHFVFSAGTVFFSKKTAGTMF